MYKEFKPNVQSEAKSSQQSPSHGAQATANGPAPPPSSRKGSLSKNTSFKSEQSNTSMDSERKKKKK